MTSKQRFRSKYRLQLREKDHEPMHVHLVGGDVNVRIDLASLRIVRREYAGGSEARSDGLVACAPGDTD